MANGGFLDTKRTNTAGIGFVVALHGAVLGALILAPPETIKRIVYVPLQMIDVPEPPAPKPLPPEPPKQAAEPRVDQVTRAVSPVPTPGPVLPALDRPVVPPLPPLPLPDVARPEPKPAPVLVEAQADPRYAADFQPAYPPAMARQEIEGRAVVRVLIGTDGRVKSVERVSATDAAFFEATERQALRRWRFRPATRDGVAVESWRTMTVRFRLQA